MRSNTAPVFSSVMISEERNKNSENIPDEKQTQSQHDTLELIGYTSLYLLFEKYHV